MNSNIESFIKKLENNDEYTFTLEISPQAKYDLSYIEEKINNSQIQNYVDAFVVTDSPFANIKISPILAAIQLQQRLNNNKPFIATQTMRDKNSIALQNDLIGANYFDIRMILAVTGDAIANGNQKQAKGVFEGNSNLLIDIIKNLNKSKSLGEFTFKEPLKPIYPFCVINSYAKNDDSLKVRLAKKANSGVKAIFTQPIYEVERLEFLLKCIDELPLKEKPILVPGFFPVLTYKTAYFIYYKLSGSYIPEKWLSKLKKASDKSEEEERKTAIELSSKLFEDMLKIHKKMHIMSLNNYEFVVDLLKNI
ncbi:methylenetetrahydrofolate reductase [Brachyspira pilosicoli]|uniref:methylenetetrahydrofolate reductase n=1 Tax=Brachyspira pilosicoli TaxID=52584 RepID=UPI001CA53C19|nr:methylenetetrahydrofolate reductase [Brachyspira pilosicoli]MBW5397271.1 methylenetetrahydrofolate reductase [Brachyspira pilosicoli]